MLHPVNTLHRSQVTVFILDDSSQSYSYDLLPLIVIGSSALNLAVEGKKALPILKSIELKSLMD